MHPFIDCLTIVEVYGYRVSVLRHNSSPVVTKIITRWVLLEIRFVVETTQFNAEDTSQAYHENHAYTASAEGVVVCLPSIVQLDRYRKHVLRLNV